MSTCYQLKMSFFALVSYSIFSMNSILFFIHLAQLSTRFISSKCASFDFVDILFKPFLVSRAIGEYCFDERLDSELTSIDSFPFQSICFNLNLECLKANFRLNTKFFTTYINNSSAPMVARDH